MPEPAQTQPERPLDLPLQPRQHLSMFDCPECGPVRHQPIPEDESHCWCFYDRRGALATVNECPCPCHAPTWLKDASVPDFTPAELVDPWALDD